ncbi:MAG: type IV pili twitching motility protein PilT [Candidatus Staskawiczbacteria bacterium RIFOXYD2_FULL_37_9]|uniref:Type IV pili twitching motility protein PilT n=1 Tax=Candidatus Staskawiczbacteria bacterium RIFOXYB1_FULL_37_44 TaxID=1802223 RepID=A0A1G2IXB1_9BACT|nr:MAG: type IV pili twitching motility protein PilT [Candidatus Staskawiczbacteria bacterium RIFOXYB1_FULL_37_44]OGZ84794.1 MAG: type IV pili twitching motility protein PilT [Candidatus Staskawiczbacteria bacterium RIFOXYC1_FULL_37_52]OGZ88081.1 MAG: type IV pili twitching motility protein PilT [Candidatus Staskawiczbacteria bacterium RIFOXYC2_FULL_37_19]OGZ90408.1 MAG: type IV pili twitching motility protein PilT [Candidatus Staskawiczbacteria bacterium RIFOXYD1_FULL_37_110]OGZ93457.1 MAG: ty
MDYLQYLKKLLDLVVREEASDLDISVGHAPNIRITGQLVPLVQEKIIIPEDSQGIAFSIMSEAQRKKLMEEKEADFSYQHEDKGRFRVNIFFQRGTISLALRFIPSKIRTIEELGLPPILHDFSSRPQGLILVTGATSQGKSTTLAAMLDEINRTRAVHIITVEDPIEYTYPVDKAIIDQREVAIDTLNFDNALRASLRQNPDVIMVGEMRDLETISTTITAAETGHLVFATLHTNSAAQTIHRIVDVFPGDQQGQIRFQLSGSLLGIISQRLIPRIKGGFVPVCEVLICNNAVSTLIRENKIHEIPAVIETSAKEGMISSSRAMVDLVRKKEVSLKNATDYAMDPSEVRNLLK